MAQLVLRVVGKMKTVRQEIELQLDSAAFHLP